MRVYLPLTVTDLADLHARGRIATPPFVAHAVTPSLRLAWADSDEDELEYAVLMAAAFGSLTRIADTGARPRRVVVVAEVDEANVLVGDDETEVVVSAEIPLARCTAVHVDDIEAEADVALAMTLLPQAAEGDGRALAAVSLMEHELMWFATQEIPDLLN
ncbi:unannotated protein [freshwater metagenome]|uniref:Unannotated protein n=1 Tax=freshwater metagenome TaxID=449393 RepID=A0A6J7KNV2_9ZZZZ|nr:hypothetical protein [Actinomycetota bacterium]MSW37516.1 hypothetical protein [Actinomycetota bacterium]